MSHRYAIGDVHGCLLTLREMVEVRLGLGMDDLLVMMGDYVDRGPDSKGVLDYLSSLQQDGYDVVILRGNHDDMIVRARFSELWEASCLRNGGDATLRSFGVERHRDIPIEYCDMIDRMPLIHLEPDFILVHASLNTIALDPFTDYHSMLFAREEIIKYYPLHGRRLVCGHTPQTQQEIRWRIDEGRKIIVDAGCVYNDREGRGWLCALNLDTMETIFQHNIDAR